MTVRRNAIPYREAIAWLLHNDDTEWIHDREPIPSVTASLVADIYGRDTGQVVADLRRATARHDLRTRLAREGIRDD